MISTFHGGALFIAIRDQDDEAVSGIYYEFLLGNKRT